MATVSPDELNQTARVVLGMLAEGHTTGYAIKAEIERSTRLFWGASAGGIYPELRRLTEAGLVTVRDDPRGETRRHCYLLTRAGHEILTDWLNDETEPVFEMRNESLLRLRFAAVLPSADRVAIVRRMRDLHERRLAVLEAILDADVFDDRFDRMATEYGIGIHRWARDWAQAAEHEVEADT